MGEGGAKTSRLALTDAQHTYDTDIDRFPRMKIIPVAAGDTFLTGTPICLRRAWPLKSAD